ncbi:MAG: transposase [Acidobacteriaceae bacterium]|jgi:putative transposase
MFARQKLTTYAITISTLSQHRHFQKTASAELFIETLFRYRYQNKFLLHGFAVMPDHVHLLITPSMDHTTARCVQLIKGGYSHAAAGHGLIWHSGYFEHSVRDENDFSGQLAYIAANPIRRQYVDYPHVHTRYLDRMDPSPTQS